MQKNLQPFAFFGKMLMSDWRLANRRFAPANGSLKCMGYGAPSQSLHRLDDYSKALNVCQQIFF